MKPNKIAAFLAAITLTELIGCMNHESIQPAPDDESTSSTVQPAELFRPDQNGTINPGEGSWGTWQQNIYCNRGAWAIGYRMRVEHYGGVNFDDTALNSVQLLCKDPVTGALEWISSYDGLWGPWWDGAGCIGDGNYLKAARIRIEGSLGSGDDTSANDVEFYCTNGGPVHAPGGMYWGDWGFWHACPDNTAVCGLNIKFEGWQGNGDDTAMNGLLLNCCTLP